MPDRRDIIALGAVTGALWAVRSRAFGALASPRAARLETRLFNFRSDVTPGQASAAVKRFKARAAAAGLDGFMLGRNALPQQFPTRFEWIYMAQWNPAASPPSRTARALFDIARDQLVLLCRNQAVCDLNCPLPGSYGGGAGVRVRHTVMFSFKPEASPEDRERNVNAIRGMGRLPMVQNYIVEQHMPSAAGPDQMDWQVVGDFASMADYKAYSDSPVHMAIREDFTAHTARVAFLDVEL